MNARIRPYCLSLVLVIGVAHWNSSVFAVSTTEETVQPAPSAEEGPRPMMRRDYLRKGYANNYRDTYTSKSYSKDYREQYRQNPIHTGSSDSATRRMLQSQEPNNPGDYTLRPQRYYDKPEQFYSPGQLNRMRNGRPDAGALPDQGGPGAGPGTGQETAPTQEASTPNLIQKPAQLQPPRPAYRPALNPNLYRYMYNRSRAASGSAAGRAQVSAPTAEVNVGASPEEKQVEIQRNEAQQPGPKEPQLLTPSEQLFTTSLDALRDRKFFNALESLNSLINLSPNDEQAQLAYGYALFYTGNYSEAVEALQKSTSLANEHLSSTEKLEEQMVQMEAYPFYRRRLERFVEINPNNVDASSLLLLLPPPPERAPQPASAVRVNRRAAERNAPASQPAAARQSPATGTVNAPAQKPAPAASTQPAQSQPPATTQTNPGPNSGG